MLDVKVKLGHQPQVIDADDLAEGVSPRHPEPAAASDDGAIHLAGGRVHAHHGERAPVVLPGREHEFGGGEQAAPAVGHREDAHPLRPAQQRRARVGPLPQVVVEHADVGEGGGGRQILVVGHRRVGAAPRLVEVEVHVGELLAGGIHGGAVHEGDGCREEQ